MTSLHVQQLQIDDCESTIQQGFYQWGSNTKDPHYLVWEKASLELRQKTVKRGYDLYEGLQAPPGNTITAIEVYLSIGANSWATVYDAIRYVACSDEAQPLLARLPQQLTLERATDTEVSITVQLIDLFRGKYQIQLSKATKFLYKKRPNLIPMIDSSVSLFLEQNFPFRLEEELPTQQVLLLFREIVQRFSQPLANITANLSRDELNLSKTRVLSYLIWLEWTKRSGGLDSLKKRRSATMSLWQVSSIAEAKRLAQQAWERPKNATTS